LISPRQKSWIAFLKNVVAVSGLLVVLNGVTMSALASRHPDPATGRTVEAILWRRHTWFLTPREAAVDMWITFGGAATFIAAIFAIRIIGSYDPQSANLPPRPPGVDPLGE
jgi:hypothetical protein